MDNFVIGYTRLSVLVKRMDQNGEQQNHFASSVTLLLQFCFYHLTIRFSNNPTPYIYILFLLFHGPFSMLRCFHPKGSVQEQAQISYCHLFLTIPLALAIKATYNIFFGLSFLCVAFINIKCIMGPCICLILGRGWGVGPMSKIK